MSGEAKTQAWISAAGVILSALIFLGGASYAFGSLGNRISNTEYELKEQKIVLLESVERLDARVRDLQTQVARLSALLEKR